MNQKENILRFARTSGWCKSICVVMILFAYMLILPTSAMALESDGNQLVNQQQIAVKGIVLDPEGEPVIGATVQVEGTSTGTITDIDGNFSLFASPDAILVVSYVGYAGQKVKVSQQVMRIVLQEDSELLDEVVVVGYGTVKRANLAGSVSSVEMKDLEDIPATSIASALVGTMSGVTIEEPTGNPLGNSTIQIRIAGSWNAEEPLYVIDGFIRDVEAFNLLDASEIDNISILKDASAAVYGVRGAGGVVLITTKRGKEQKTSISYNGSVGFSQGVNMPDMMSSVQQATALNDMYREIRYNGTESIADSQFFTAADMENLKNVNYNWLDDAWKTAMNTRHTLNVSGGTDKVRYFIGGSYQYNDGNFEGLSVNRYTFRSGLDVKFNNQFKASFGINYAERDTKQPLNSDDREGDRMYGTFSSLVRVSRWIPAYIDGKAVNLGETGDDVAVSHPLELLNSGSSKRGKNNDVALSGKFDYDVKWVKGLSASLSLNYSRQSSWSRQIYRPYYVYNFERDGHFYNSTNVIGDPVQVNNKNQYQEAATFGYSWQINPQVNYQATFGDHDVSAMYVFEASEGGGNDLSIMRTNMILEGIDMLNAYEINSEMTTSANMNTNTRRLSHIVRAGYGYANRYIVEGTLRCEASTNFAPGYRWGLFGSVQVAWRISEESWFRDNVSFMDNLKLRGSYGRLGNDKASLKQWRQNYGYNVDKFIQGSTPATVLTLYPSMGGLTAYDSSWEKSDSYNGGLDFRFTNGIYGSIDGFYRYTFDILDEATSVFPQSAGVTGSTPKLNYGIQSAWGGELELGYQKRLNKDWSINIKGNLSYATSKIIKKYTNEGYAGTWRDIIGTSNDHVTGYKVWRGVDGKGDGLARTWDDINAYIAYLEANAIAAGGSADDVRVLGLTKDQLRPGMLMFEDRGTTVADQTPDGQINDDGDNGIIAKHGTAPYAFGYTLGFNWKNLSVSAIFNGSFGHKIVYEKGFFGDFSGNRSSKFLSENSNLLSEWYGNYAIADTEGDASLINPDAKYPRLDTQSFRSEISEFWMRNGLNMRLRTLNVSYSLPAKTMKSVGIASCRIYFVANNIWTIINPYPYKDAYVGYWSDYPQIRTFNFGVNITL